jgi:Protein of unknown function (DUF3485)
MKDGGQPTGEAMRDSRRAWILAHLDPHPDREPQSSAPTQTAPVVSETKYRSRVGRAAAAVTASVVLLGAGVARRRLTDDAGAARVLAGAAARVPSLLPQSVGTWTGTEVDVDRHGLDGAGIAALAARRYTDSATGESVTTVLLCGRAGPIAAHGPEACYPGVGFTTVSAPRRLPVPELGLALWSATFQGGAAAAPQDLVVSWAWADRGGWSTPDNPRLRFASAARLYKIYLLYESGPDPPAGAAFPPLRLAEELLPKLDAAVAFGP